MYILRAILRAPLQRPPARLISGRRFRQSRNSQTRWYSTDPSTPNGTDGKPVVGGKNGTEDDKTSVGEASEQKDVGTAPEDAEHIAQNLQRSQEMTRRYSSALRRTQRRNRAQDLPPVVIPNWFLEERIILHNDASAPSTASGSKQSEITLRLKQHDEKDAAQCSIPISNPFTGVRLLDQWVSSAWHGELMANQSQDFARTLAAEWRFGDHQSIIDALEQGADFPSSDEKFRKLLLLRLHKLGVDLVGTEQLLKPLDNDLLTRAKQNYMKASRLLGASVRSYEATVPASQSQGKHRPHVSPFTLAEIRATMAASLSALQPAINDTFPSARTNLILHSPHANLDGTIRQAVKGMASELGADMIELSAQDLAEICGDYLGEGSEPSLHSIRSLGYETHRLTAELGSEVEDLGNPETAEAGEEAPQNSFPSTGSQPPFTTLPPLIIPLSSMLKNLTENLKSVQLGHEEQETPPSDVQGRVLTKAEIQLEDLKISNLLEHIIGSVDAKRSTSNSGTESGIDERPTQTKQMGQPISPEFFDFPTPTAQQEIDLFQALPRKAATVFDITANIKAQQYPTGSPRSKVIHIQDFRELSATHYGSRIIQKLEDIVRRRRNAGESIMIVGTTCSRDLTPESSVDGVQGIQAEGDAGFFRSIVVPAETAEDFRNDSTRRGDRDALDEMLTSVERKKLGAINTRHIQNMLHALDPRASRQISLRSEFNKMNEIHIAEGLFPAFLCSRIMTHDEVHRVALTTLGLHLIDPVCDALKWTHVALAISLLKASDEAKFSLIKRMADKEKFKSLNSFKDWTKKMATASQSADAQARNRRQTQLSNITATADKYEKRLMPGIVNPEQIKIGFGEVHVPPETVDSIKTLTSMSFLRPDAFNYGVLATEKISGALLYGPPGTGKTLLAKAVAKESGCSVLEVSGSQIHDKYVGEGEKNVTAIFSLARKLSPCIVFLDEADAVLSSRDSGRERASGRDILNQFLKEWDGLNNNSVFVMVATNRPFDLDDAVIRRLPRRLLVDLPTERDREEILKIHLRDEQLDESVDLASLAQQTSFYSGSDLKNVAVAAALACVKEENEQAIIAAAKSAVDTPANASTNNSTSQLLQGVKYDFPEKRTLHVRHFDKALQEISASISEDMGSLNAIKKFDEKYGDKKGKKKKRIFGLGPTVESSEASARVRP
ncbi:unnamed protein product [Periconia digitata]|uniref:AAA+ ATPase domain-containing protein n=1 Tax=Periconia digitata TaxID=1303443 RepID=A0A9W4U445_9PLEO|nr:unnamed protein product [Periconia digitata]